MNTATNTAADRELQAGIAVPAAQPRPLYWSLRRELWENRSLTVAPVAIAALCFFAFTISTIGMPARRHDTLLLAEAKRRATINEPFDGVAVAMFASCALIAAWKSTFR